MLENKEGKHPAFAFPISTISCKISCRINGEESKYPRRMNSCLKFVNYLTLDLINEQWMTEIWGITPINLFFRKNTILNLEQLNKSWLKSQGVSLKITWLLRGAQHLSKHTIFLLTAYHRIQVQSIYRSFWFDPYPYPLS